MISIQAFMDQLSNDNIVNPLISMMTESFEDFAKDRALFEETLSLLSTEMGKDSTPSVSDAMDAIHQQIASTLLFSCFLGVKANLDHFKDPIGHNFLDADPEIYLREDVAKRLPEYESAQRVQEQFYAALPPALQDRYADIAAYISHLETVGPKLAHYYGYILGNLLFSRIIPGYVADVKLTQQYRSMLSGYLGIQIR